MCAWPHAREFLRFPCIACAMGAHHRCVTIMRTHIDGPCTCLCSHRRHHNDSGGIHKDKQRKTQSDAGRKHDKPEARLQVACVAWCDAADIFIDGWPGGAAFMKGTHTARGCSC